MRLRVKDPSRQLTARLELPPTTTLTALLAAAAEQLNTTRPVRLSLNRRDVLGAAVDGDAGARTLAELGLASGDLLYLLFGTGGGGAVAPRAAAAAPRAAPPAAAPAPLLGMGFAEPEASRALAAAGGDVQAAVALLLASAPDAKAAAQARPPTAADAAAPKPAALAAFDAAEAVGTLGQAMSRAGFAVGALAASADGRSVALPFAPGGSLKVEARAEPVPFFWVGVAQEGGSSLALEFPVRGRCSPETHCALLGEFRQRILLPLQLEVAHRGMVAACAAQLSHATDALVLAIHACMVCAGFVAEGELSHGWNLGHGAYAFTYAFGDARTAAAEGARVVLRCVVMGQLLMVHAMVGDDGEVFNATLPTADYHCDSAGWLRPDSLERLGGALQLGVVSRLVAVFRPPPTLSSLPTELRLVVFSHLEAKDLLSVGGVCRELRAASMDKPLWRELLRVDFPLRAVVGDDCRQTYVVAEREQRQRRRTRDLIDRDQMAQPRPFPGAPPVGFPEGGMPGTGWPGNGNQPGNFLVGGDYDLAPGGLGIGGGPMPFGGGGRGGRRGGPAMPGFPTRPPRGWGQGSPFGGQPFG